MVCVLIGDFHCEGWSLMACVDVALWMSVATIQGEESITMNLPMMINTILHRI